MNNYKINLYDEGTGTLIDSFEGFNTENKAREYANNNPHDDKTFYLIIKVNYDDEGTECGNSVIETI